MEIELVRSATRGDERAFTEIVNSVTDRFVGVAHTNETDYREGATTLAHTGDVGTVRTGLIRIVNDEGSWEGQFQNLQLENLDFASASGW